MTNAKDEDRIYCLPPLYDGESSRLILGTIPGVESLKLQTYYANENNLFWDFMYRIFEQDYPAYIPFDFDTPREERYELLRVNSVALWDVVSDCFRSGSNDSKITDAKLNNVAEWLKGTNIKSVICNGEKSFNFLRKTKQLNEMESNGIIVLKMNSTSSLNPNNTFKIFRDWQLCLQKV